MNTPLPVPATRGGAIETLATNLIQENENSNELDLTVISVQDRKAQSESHNYRATNFIYIPRYRRIFHKIFIHYPQAVLSRIKHSPHLATTYEEIALAEAMRQDPDILVIEGGDMQGPAALKKFSIPCVYHLHFNPEQPFANSGYSDVFSVSDFVGNSWQKLNRGLPTRIQTVRNGVPQYFAKTIPAEQRFQIRAKLGLDNDDFAVLYCGRIIPEKGVEQLLQAFNKINDPHIRLVMIGGTEFKNSQETEFSRRIGQIINNLGTRVITLGYQEHSMVSVYQKICDLQVVPSIWEDAAPLVSVEAMASGLPLIVTRSGGLPEYVSADAALILDKDDDLVDHLAKAIVRLKDAPEECRVMSRAGREAAKNYTTHSYYQNYVKAIRNAIQWQNK